jgi:hypothetical protein
MDTSWRDHAAAFRRDAVEEWEWDAAAIDAILASAVAYTSGAFPLSALLSALPSRPTTVEHLVQVLHEWTGCGVCVVQHSVRTLASDDEMDAGTTQEREPRAGEAVDDMKAVLTRAGVGAVLFIHVSGDWKDGNRAGTMHVYVDVHGLPLSMLRTMPAADARRNRLITKDAEEDA